MMRRALWLGWLVAIVGCGGSTAGESSSDASVDARSDAASTCTALPPQCGGCCGGGTGAECVAGEWQCPVCAGSCANPDASTDAGAPHDAASDGAPSDAGPLACGTSTCDPSGQYCMVVGGGVQPADGGSNMSYTCTALPADCHGTASCACVEADGGGNGCPCSEDAGAVTVECLYP